MIRTLLNNFRIAAVTVYAENALRLFPTRYPLFRATFSRGQWIILYYKQHLKNLLQHKFQGQIMQFKLSYNYTDQHVREFIAMFVHYTLQT